MAEVKVNIVGLSKVTEGAVAIAGIAVTTLFTPMPARLFFGITRFDRERGGRGRMVDEVIAPVATPITATAALIGLSLHGENLSRFAATADLDFLTTRGLCLRLPVHLSSFKIQPL
jgi:hypothetical protein